VVSRVGENLLNSLPERILTGNRSRVGKNASKKPPKAGIRLHEVN
jgi:hypothetical protein